MSESSANNVNVTKLQQPSSVSIASEEPQLHPVPQPRYGARHALRSTAGQDSVRPGTLDYTRFDSLPDSDSDQRQEPTSPDTPASTSAAETKPPPTASKASLSLDGLQRNGSSTNSHLWSQSRDEAIVHARAPSSIRGPSVRVQLHHGTLRIDASDFTEPLLHRQLAYRVHEPEHGDASEDFELTHVSDETFISVTLRYAQSLTCPRTHTAFSSLP